MLFITTKMGNRPLPTIKVMDMNDGKIQLNHNIFLKIVLSQKENRSYR